MILILLSFTLTACISTSKITDVVSNIIDEQRERNENDDDLEMYFDSEDDDLEMNINQSNSQDWPEEIPNYVPQLDGEINAIIRSADEEVISQTINFIDVKTNLQEFKQLLSEEKGWTIITESTQQDGWTINAVHESNETFLLAMVHSNDEGAIQVTYKKL